MRGMWLFLGQTEIILPVLYCLYRTVKRICMCYERLVINMCLISKTLKGFMIKVCPISRTLKRFRVLWSHKYIDLSPEGFIINARPISRTLERLELKSILH
jgi:hypothetical protein